MEKMCPVIGMQRDIDCYRKHNGNMRQDEERFISMPVQIIRMRSLGILNSDNTIHPVGKKKPNGFGLYDMSGNVCEWIWDWMISDEYQDRISGVVDPKGVETAKSGTSRAFRGGACNQSWKSQQCSYRNGLNPTVTKNYIGFRIALNA